jgi:hypothetical protein
VPYIPHITLGEEVISRMAAKKGAKKKAATSKKK